MLVGPPGVGKSYAVLAVKELMKGMANIELHSINIPDLLIDTQPIEQIEKLFSSLSSQQSHSSQASTLSSTRLSPLKSGRLAFSPGYNPSESKSKVKPTIHFILIDEVSMYPVTME